MNTNRTLRSLGRSGALSICLLLAAQAAWGQIPHAQRNIQQQLGTELQRAYRGVVTIYAMIPRGGFAVPATRLSLMPGTSFDFVAIGSPYAGTYEWVSDPGLIVGVWGEPREGFPPDRIQMGNFITLTVGDEIELGTKMSVTVRYTPAEGKYAGGTYNAEVTAGPPGSAFTEQRTPTPVEPAPTEPARPADRSSHPLPWGR